LGSDYLKGTNMVHESEKYNGRIVDLEDLIPSDEPVFLIRAQDKLAGDVVRYYAKLYETLSISKGINNLEKVNSIRKHARLMDGWTPKKLAD
jgi:hypothetical protein